MESYHHILVNDLKSFAGIEGKTVLVIGCGYGLECEILLSLGAEKVVGVDVLDNLGKDYPHKDIEYCRVKAEEMAFDDNSFDICCSFATLEHIQDPHAALQNMLRVIEPYGFLYCQAAPLWNSPFGHHKRDMFPDDPWIHLRMNSPEKMMSYYDDICEQVIDGHKVRDHIAYIFSDEFNRISVSELKKIVFRLMEKANPVSIRFGMNYDDYHHLLSPELRSELKAYTEEELLTEGMTIVLRKL